ncbi:MAG: histidine kinase dimerization/phospho-acceptor domain-containing protein [Rhizomicrobium sp.]
MRERAALHQGLWWLCAGFLASGALALVSVPYVPALLLSAGVLGAAAALVLGLRSREDGGAAGADGGASPNAELHPRAREIFERLPDPLMLLDEASRVILANTAMIAVVGTDTQKKHVFSVLRTPALLEAVERTVASGEPSSVEFSVRVPVERYYQAYVIRTEHSPRVTAVLLHDTTTTLRAEEARADFVANASHELRTSLAALTGFIDTLKGHAKDDAVAREKFLDIMSVEADRMRRLIDNLLSLTRIEQNEHVPPQDEVDVHGVVRDAASALQGLARLDDMTLSVAEANGMPPILGDRDELIQLFQNLMHNAIKYGRPGGHVWVSLAPAFGPGPPPGRHSADSFVSVAVRDDGEGIPREAIPRLTERFYRVDVRRSRERLATSVRSSPTGNAGIISTLQATRAINRAPL